MRFGKRSKSPMPLSTGTVIVFFLCGLVGIVASVPAGSYLISSIHNFEYDHFLIYNLHQYRDTYNPVIQNDIKTALYMMTAIVIGGFALGYFATYEYRKGEYNNARFARTHEIRKAGLFAKNGLIIGYYKNRLIRTSGPAPASLLAPTRQGKGVSFVVPNMLECKKNMLVFDMKGELFHVSSGRRKNKFGHSIAKFDPWDSDKKTDGFNPFDYVEWGTEMESTQLSSIAFIFVPDQPNSDPVWAQSARELFIGLAYLLKDLEPITKWPVTLGQMSKLIQPGIAGFSVSEVILSIADLSQVSSKARTKLSVLSGTAVKMIDSFIGTLRASLTNFDNPLLDRATSVSTFDLHSLHKQKMTVYLCTPPAQRMDQVAPIIRQIASSLVFFSTETLPEHNPNYKYDVYIMADELPAWGKINSLIKGVGYISGYGLRLVSVYQSPSQLQGEGLYAPSDNKNFLSNQATVQIYGTENAEDARSISDMVGTVEVIKETRSHGSGSKGGSTSTSIASESFLKPQNIINLGKTFALIFEAGIRPFLVKRIVWYKDRRFKNLPEKPADIKVLNNSKASNFVTEFFSFEKTSGLLAIPQKQPIPDSDLIRLGNRIAQYAIVLVNNEKG